METLTLQMKRLQLQDRLVTSMFVMKAFLGKQLNQHGKKMEFTIGELKVSNCILFSQRNEISASTKQGLEVDDTQ